MKCIKEEHFKKKRGRTARNKATLEDLLAVKSNEQQVSQTEKVQDV